MKMSTLRPYDKEWLEELCASSFSLAEVLSKAGRKGGGSQQTLKKKIEEFGIDTSHFHGQAWNKGKTMEDDNRIVSSEKYSIEEVFVKDSKISWKVTRGYLERHKLIPYVCASCGCDGSWQGGQIALEVHHQDGDNTNNELSNLHYLCPNCHALTENYRGKNKGANNNSKFIPKTKEPIVEEVFVEALQTSPSIRQALLKLGLSAAGANYDRAKALVEKYEIKFK
jgi:hypothetical protein